MRWNKRIMLLEKKRILKRLKEISKDLPDNFKEEILAYGLIGSFARNTAKKHSDIDIFVITKEDKINEFEFYKFFKEKFKNFQRDITIITYSLFALKKIPCWHTLIMCKEGIFTYDKGNIKKIFKEILKLAKKHGVIWDNKKKVFVIKDAPRIVKFELE